MDLPSAIGLGLDIAGATIIAVGLLGSPSTVALRAATFLGGNSHAAAAAVESRADAEFGIPVLIAGFTGQLIGLSVHSQAATSLGYLVAFICAGGGLAIWWYLWRPRRAKRVAVEVAHYDVLDARAMPRRYRRPEISTLVSLGIGLAEPLREGESNEQYVNRIFNVTETRREDGD